MVGKQDLSRILKKESATTLKTMRAFPEDKLLFTPHERSRNARQTMATFVFEMYLIEFYVFVKKIDRAVFQTYAPVDLNSLVSDFEKENAWVASMIEKMSDADMEKTVEFAGSKFSAGDFILMMLFDQIHHRGQLTVYIRLAGGIVPSVDGPSGDDRSTNF